MDTAELGKRTQPFTENRTRLFVAPVRYDVARLLADAAARGWDDAELARRSGLSPTAIYRLRRGASRASTIAKLAGALGEPVSRYMDSEAA